MNAENAAKFHEAVRGIPTNSVVRAMNLQTRGDDWSRCSKALMAEMGPDNLDLVKLVADARKHHQVTLEWRDRKTQAEKDRAKAFAAVAAARAAYDDALAKVIVFVETWGDSKHMKVLVSILKKGRP